MSELADRSVWLFLALLLDAALGEPAVLWRNLPHPVALMGRAIGWLDGRFNRETDSPTRRRTLGALSLFLLLTAAGILGWGLAWLLTRLPGGWLAEIFLVAVFLAGRSLFDHVSAVAQALERDGLAAARVAVAKIVGRDPQSLDAPAVCRAAIESGAENLSDGLIAPALYYLLGGLPGLFVYKALNTADSMIGYRTPRHAAFGYAAARLDDLANWLPARLTGFLLTLSASALPGLSGGAAWRAMRRDAPRHRSPNAGWPEAAAAGALGLALAGPRRYGKMEVPDAWMNAKGDPHATPAHIRRFLGLAVLATILFGGLLLTVFVGLSWLA